jgi:hypothetical protein
LTTSEARNNPDSDLNERHIGMDEEHIGMDEDDEELRANARLEKRRASFGERDEDDVQQEKSVSGLLGHCLLTPTWNVHVSQH